MTGRQREGGSVWELETAPCTQEVCVREEDLQQWSTLSLADLWPLRWRKWQRRDSSLWCLFWRPPSPGASAGWMVSNSPLDQLDWVRQEVIGRGREGGKGWRKLLLEDASVLETTCDHFLSSEPQSWWLPASQRWTLPAHPPPPPPPHLVVMHRFPGPMRPR